MGNMSTVQTKGKAKEISKIWLHNNISASLIIPVEIARKHNLTKGNHVVVEDTEAGILIRRAGLKRRQGGINCKKIQTVRPNLK